MKSSILRQFWSLIEEIQFHTFLNLNDRELTEQLLRQLENKQPLSPEESQMMNHYIHSRLLLIHELFEDRLAQA